MANYVATTGTYNINGTDMIPNIARDVLYYDRASVPIQTIMMSTGKVESTFNMTFQWQEGQYDDPNTTSSAISSSAAGVPQALTIQSQNVRVGDTFYEPVSDQQFECVLVNSYGAGTTNANFLKTPSTVSTSAVAGTPLFIRTGNIAVEGGPFPESTTNTPTRFSNGCSLVTGSIEVTNIMRDTPTYYNNGNELGHQKTAGIQQFRGNMERRIIWSKYFQESRTQTHSGITHTGTAYSGDGFVPRITTNVVTYAGTLTEATLDSYLTTIWGRRYYGGDMKFGFGGPDVFKDINGFAKDKIRVMPVGTNTWGLTITTYLAYAGQKLYLVLEREFMNDNPQYKKALVTIDPAYWKIRYHGPALMMVHNTTPPRQMVESLGLESRVGSQLEFEKASGILKQ
jgi:hypothetical protein